MYQPNRSLLFILILIIFGSFACAFVLQKDSSEQSQRSNAHITNTPNPNQFISISDIHFNPFFDTSLVKQLIAADMLQWEGILQATTGFGTFNRHAPSFDSPYPLFKSALVELKKLKPNPDFITISGDFLCHDFQSTFQSISGLKDQQSLYDFSSKTIAFIGHMIHKTFPKAPIFPTLGNNDAFCGDYNLQANGPFLDSMTHSWSKYVNHGKVKSTFTTDFPTYGNYIADLPGTNNRIIGLNTIFFSSSIGWHSPYFCTVAKAPADEVLSWLGKALRNSKGKNVWLLYHIPPGINTFNSDQIPAHSPDSCSVVKGVASLFMTSDANNRLVDTIAKYGAANIIKANLAGHSHMNEFRIIYDDQNIPQSFIHISPSISPINSNNPAVAIYTYDKNSTFQITNTETWYFQGVQNPGHNVWVKEFDFSQYGVSAMTAGSMQKIYEKIQSDYSTRQLYMNNYYSSRNTRLIQENQERALECAISQMTVHGYDDCYCNSK